MRQQHQQQQQQQLDLMERRRQQERGIEETVELINTFILSTTQFLNRFASQCDSKLYQVGRTLDRLETQTALLEFKIRSVDGARAFEDGDDEDDEDTRSSAGRTSPSITSSSSLSSSPSSPSSASAGAARALTTHPSVLRVKDRSAAVTSNAEKPRQRTSRKSARREEGDPELPRPPPPAIPSRRSVHPPPPGVKKGRQPPLPPKFTAAPSASDHAPAALFLAPPLLPLVGADAGLPLPPPPLPRRLRAPNRDLDADPKKGSGATYTMRTHPRLRGYFDLLTLRVPVEEVRRRMEANGVNPAWLDTPDTMTPADFSDYVEEFAEGGDDE